MKSATAAFLAYIWESFKAASKNNSDQFSASHLIPFFYFLKNVKFFSNGKFKS